jgi:hypothetical protein|nr:MAG TPA: hypothetical protein [Caudoviricetes sp.]
MAEYIDRDAALTAVDETYLDYLVVVRDAVLNIPAADVAPVVRCKDCKQLQCCNFTQFLGADGYCSYGEYKRNTEGIKWQTKR